MRVLVVGAGALGGYFGGCLVKGGRDVAFLARGQRAAQLAADGLRITGPHVSFAGPVRAVLAGSINETFDLVLLAVKAYGLEGAMQDMAPAIGPATVILPVLNGMSHIDTLSAAFGADRVLGGMAQIGATLSADGLIELQWPHPELVFGELAGGTSGRASAIHEVLTVEGFRARLSAEVTQDMWEKWMIVGTVAGSTCLMRASIGDGFQQACDLSADAWAQFSALQQRRQPAGGRQWVAVPASGRTEPLPGHGRRYSRPNPWRQLDAGGCSDGLWRRCGAHFQGHCGRPELEGGAQ
jgi:2-dehydropantoate 2-reductase